MEEQIISDLEKAADIIMAPPNLISNEQRHSAEVIFLNFRKSKSPYTLCRRLLETSQVSYVLFEAAEVLKNALIREWSLLPDSDILSLRQYLMHYVINKDIPAYVQDRILQVIAIMVKRGSVDDFGQDRFGILNEVENLILNGNSAKQILGCNLISNLMQEYANTIRSTDVGLTWEVHFKAKKQFEATDLKRIFKFCVHLLSEIVKNDPPYSDNLTNLMTHLLSITAGVLTWGYISPMLPKRLIGVYEAVFEADQTPALRLSALWRDVMLAPELHPLMFQVYWKTRDQENLAHYSLICLVQLSSLNGAIMNTDEMRLRYLSSYMENFLKLITSVNVRTKESLGISNIVRKLQLFFGHDLLKLPLRLQESYLDDITRLTCCFAEGAAIEESQGSEEKYYVEAFDNMLEAWTNILQEFSSVPDSVLRQSASQIFNTYLQCHLSPPDGTRRNCDEVEEIEDNEDNDRNKFKDQLQAVGMFGRIVPHHVLPVLYKFLEDRTNKLKNHLNIMQSQAMSLNDSNILDNIFEDIHWVILIAGHVLCMDSEGETPMIPSEIMQYSIEQCNKSESTLEGTLKTMASVRQLGFDISFIDQCDHSIRIAADVLRLCHVETSAATVKLAHFMSPEVGCTLMWFLKRWCLSYLLPTEHFYQEISPTLIGALGKDTDAATFIVNFVLQKIQYNICHFSSEPILLQDTVDLFGDLVGIKQKSLYIVKTEGLWDLVSLQAKLEPGSLPQNVRRGLYKGFVLAGSALVESEALQNYYHQILKPVQIRFKNVLSQENFNRIYQEERIKKEIIDILECFIGIAKGAQMSTSQLLFDFLIPMLSELPVFLNLYNNYQLIVQLILELFGQCAKHVLCYLSQLDSKRLYESTLATIQIYAKCNANRFSTEVFSEESSFQDLFLVLELLTLILSKDCLDLSPLGNSDENPITAADVSLFGLNFIMPLMTIDLLKYPILCSQYYKLIVLISDIYSEKICALPEAMLRQLLSSVEIGLTQFGSDIIQACLDFIQSLATHIHRNSLQNLKVYEALMPFIKLLLDLTLSHQINSDMMISASTCMYCLICCYSEQYQILVQNIIQSQSDHAVAQRLASAFTQLTNNVQLTCERQSKLKFRDNFDKFIANVHGFLLVK